MATQKDPGIAALLEVVPGLFGFLGIGHIYNGNLGKGIIFLIGYWIFLIIELILMFVIIGFLLIPINLVIILLSAYLAYQDAKKFGYEPRQQQQQQQVVIGGVEDNNKKSKRICPKCGMENDRENKFCSDCGYDFTSIKK